MQKHKKCKNTQKRKNAKAHTKAQTYKSTHSNTKTHSKTQIRTTYTKNKVYITHYPEHVDVKNDLPQIM